MEISLFHAVLGVPGVVPTDENVEHVDIVSYDFSSALSFVKKKNPDLDVLSLNFSRSVLLNGSLVDFE